MTRNCWDDGIPATCEAIHLVPYEAKELERRISPSPIDYDNLLRERFLRWDTVANAIILAR